MADLKRRLGKRIAELRDEAGLTQAQLAGTIGTAVQVISRIERGQGAPSLERLEALAEALRVDVRDLFAFDEPAKRTRTPHDAVAARFATLIRLRPIEDGELIVRGLAELFRRWPVKRR